MRASPELDRLRQELQETAGDLGRELARMRGAEAGLEGAVGDLEEVGNDYVQLSDDLAAAIAGAADEQDEEAVAQLTRLIGLDLEVAQRLLLSASLESPEDGGQESTSLDEDDPAFVELEALDDLDAVARAALTDPPRSLGLESGLEGPVGTDVAVPVDDILDEAGDTITGTVQAVAWSRVGDDFVTLAGMVAGDAARKAAESVVAAMSGLWRRATKLAARVLAAVVGKITRFIGAERVAKVFEAVQDKVASWWGGVPGEGVAAKGLGLALQRDEIVKRCEGDLEGQDAAGVADAVAASERVVEAHRESLTWVRRGNKVLDWAGGIKSFLQISGAATLVALVGAALVAYASWLTHDHLDSPTFSDQIPDRVRGVRQTVAAATAG